MAALLALAGLLGAVGSPAQTTATHTAADAAGAPPSAALVRFAVGSAPMLRAELIAAKYWSTLPCAGVVSVSWAPLEPAVNADSSWANQTSAYGSASGNSECQITLNQNQNFDWPMFCTVMVHEMGHLAGQQHSPDEGSVMYPVYLAPIAECKGSPDGLPAASPAPASVAGATAASLRSATGHKAHSRHKRHKHHHRST